MSLSVDARVARGDFRVEAAFEVAADETVALLGPNGSGKTTVALCLAGLVAPEAGAVVLDGRPLDDPAAGVHLPAELRSVGVVFQDLALFPHLTAVENAAFPLRARGVGKADARGKAISLLTRLGLSEARHGARPAELSGGEAQRVALARALIHEPRLLLMDEPSSSLDVRARAELQPLIAETLAGFAGARLLVTHDPIEAMTLADRIVVLEEGRITQSGTGEELRDAPRTQYVAELVGVNLFAGRLEPLERGAGRLSTREGALVVAWPPDAAGPISDVLGLLRPSDVVLHVAPPDGGSARNVLRGRVASLAIEGERARVRVAGAPSVVAEVTLGSVERLGLRPGVEVWASFKAVEVDLRLPAP